MIAILLHVWFFLKVAGVCALLFLGFLLYLFFSDKQNPFL